MIGWDTKIKLLDAERQKHQTRFRAIRAQVRNRAILH
jgi:hypothetical protein